MIIDFRGRPPTQEFLSYFVPDRTTWINYRLGAKAPAPSFVKADVELFFSEMEEAGITQTVALGRNSPSTGPNAPLGEIPNEHIADLVAKYPDRVIGVAGIDVGNTIHNSLDEIKRAVDVLGLRGIHIEPARSLEAFPNDRRIYPVYALCEELGVPVVIMTGPFAGRNIDFSHPSHIQDVAVDFPNLEIVCGHGCYPWVTEIIGVAFKHPNVYVSPDVYMLLPGADPYVAAANTFLQDQMIFGTAYPARPLKQTVDDYRGLRFTDEALQKLLYDNASRLLKLHDPVAGNP